MHTDAKTVFGTLQAAIDDAECFNREVIKTLEAPVQDKAGITVLKGNLAPRGAIIKPSAATANLLVHRGRAVVFESIEDYKARLTIPILKSTRLPSWFSKAVVQEDIPECQRLETWGCRLRSLNKVSPIWFGISDARMSGTAFGTVVLHVAPESSVGGPLAIVQNGDWIELDANKGILHLDISDEELAQRLETWKAEESQYNRGYYKLYIDSVLQADQGADFNFLVGQSGSTIHRESH